jgi:hypothetical protein
MELIISCPSFGNKKIHFWKLAILSLGVSIFYELPNLLQWMDQIVEVN